MVEDDIDEVVWEKEESELVPSDSVFEAVNVDECEVVEEDVNEEEIEEEDELDEDAEEEMYELVIESEEEDDDEDWDADASEEEGEEDEEEEEDPVVEDVEVNVDEEDVELSEGMELYSTPPLVKSDLLAMPSRFQY